MYTICFRNNNYTICIDTIILLKKNPNNINFHVLAFQPGMLFFDLIKVKKSKIL